MSSARKTQTSLIENSSLVQSLSLGLLLLSLFIALCVYREPNTLKKNQVLRSIASNFRKVNSSKIDKNKLQDKLVFDLSQPDLVKLTGLVTTFFTPDAKISPDLEGDIIDLARQVVLTNASLEINCQSTASGVHPETAYQRLTETEFKCERIANIFRQEGVANFNIVSRVGFRLNAEQSIEFLIRGQTFRSSWQ
jgi:hypothetical protein